MKIYLELPWTPSVNHIKTPVIRRRKGSTTLGTGLILSEKARWYRAQVAKEVLVQKPPGFETLTGRLHVEIIACPPDRRVRDLDNILKLTLDALKRAGVYKDDGLIDELHVYRWQKVRGGVLKVTICEQQSHVG